ncbi:MAG: hypothetical protein R6U84_09480 [Candidatus Cloacimonadales bacterium]
MQSCRTAFGLIIPSVTKLSPMLDFLENAEKFGHKITDLIIGYTGEVDAEIIATLEKKCNVVTIKRGDSAFLNKHLSQLGLDQQEIDCLLRTPNFDQYQMVSYGTSRNYVLLAAILLEIDYLLFFDSDIYPNILRYDSLLHQYENEEIDFVGNHLKYLRSDDDVVVTSSDYTGYYIIPKMNFPHLQELLFGVQKEDKYQYISQVEKPVVADHKLHEIFDTNKILGGNLAINLHKLEILPPFFSTELVMDNECFLGRGEDTLFSPIIHYYGGKCLDIDLLIFHDCFGDFPAVPSIDKPKNRDRFFYAMMGWAIRNPFYNWLRNEYFGKDEPIDYESRYQALIRGSKAAAEFLEDERFLKLPTAFQKSYQKLPQDIDKFLQLITVWKKMVKLIMQQRKQK